MTLRVVACQGFSAFSTASAFRQDSVVSVALDLDAYLRFDERLHLVRDLLLDLGLDRGVVPHLAPPEALHDAVQLGIRRGSATSLRSARSQPLVMAPLSLREASLREAPWRRPCSLHHVFRVAQRPSRRTTIGTCIPTLSLQTERTHRLRSRHRAARWRPSHAR